MRKVLLDRNENHYGPAPACENVLKNLSVDLLYDYSRDFQRGHYSSLSERLAELLRVDENRIVLGYGCEDLLKQAIHHFLRPGERCFIPSASWWYYGSIADEVRGTTIKYPIVERQDDYVFDVDALMRLHAKMPARVLLISSPNNPTGNTFPRERLEEVLEYFRDAVVVLDEAYWGFVDEDDESSTPLLTEKYPNLLVLRTFSKLYALAGARIGYGIAGRGMDSFLRFSARNLGYNRISEQLALAALGSPEYYRDVRKKMAQDRELFIEAIRPFDQVRAYKSSANFLLIRLPEHLKVGLHEALTSTGLQIKFFDEPSFINCARITLGTQEENKELREVLVYYLSELLGRADES